jgi:enolase
MKITKVLGFQILDSRGRPSVAARVTLEDGSSHIARVPSGASTGTHEALELRDRGTGYEENFYRGASVFGAVTNINEIIAPKITSLPPSYGDIDQILNELDPTSNHRNLGANTKLAVSLAIAKAEAHSKNLSLARMLFGEGELIIPMPMVNILSGGAHANRSLDIQDVLIIPRGANSFAQSISWIASIREIAARKGHDLGQVTHLVADEGGLGMKFPSIATACEFVISCITDSGLRPGVDVSLALDFASTQYFEAEKYNLKSEGRNLDKESYINYVASLVNNLPIISIEDPFAEDDWGSWQNFRELAPSELQILGDDLFTTNLERLERGISSNSANAILIKVNQNGLVSGTEEVLKQAQKSGFRTVVSARSGETEDSWLADLAIGWRANQIKVGSTHGSERSAKWNRLLEFEATEKTIFAKPYG